MTKQTIELHDIAEMLKAMQPSEKRSMAALDMLLKIFVGIAATVMAAGMIWLVATVNGVERQVAIMVVQQEAQKEAMSRFEAFTQKPQFTLDDFNMQVAPIVQSVRNNEAEIARRGVWMEDAKAKLNKMANDIGNMQHDIKEINDMLKDSKQ